MAATASEMPSAAKTPVTPIHRGNNKTKGTSSITLRNRAIKIEIRACPKATNIF